MNLQNLDSRVQSLTPPQPAQLLTMFRELSSRHSMPMSKSGSIQSRPSSTLSCLSVPPKTQKQTRQEAFTDKNQAEAKALASIATDKHHRKMAEHAQRMAELEIKKTRLDLEAKGKHLEAEERRIAAQHQHKCEREQHDMQMLRLRLQYQGAIGRAPVEFGMEQFAGNNTSEQFAGDKTFGDMQMNGSYLT
jgi:hypothetical protein